jgi:hypothetical protein
MKRQHIIQELLAKGITQDKNGKSIYDMDYDDLKHELVMWSFRQIDAERDSNKWF